MLTIHNVSGSDILDKYIELYEDGNKYNEKDYSHFTNAFSNWINNVRFNAARRFPTEFSLNKKNFHGKRTRALLAVIEWKEPKTLGLLVQKLWEEIPEK